MPCHSASWSEGQRARRPLERRVGGMWHQGPRAMKAWRRVWGRICLSSPDRLATLRTFGPGAMAVEALPVGPSENRSLTSLTDGEIDCPGSARREGDGDDLAASAQHCQGAMSPLETKRFDVRPRGFRHPESVEREQRDAERVRSPAPGRPPPARRRVRCNPSRPRGSHSPGEVAGRGPLGRRR